MRAFVVSAPGVAGVAEVPDPVAGPGQVVVDVERVGVCGTDVELFTGEMAYLHQGHASYPLRPGHEWCGVVSAAGDGVDPGWLGRRVTGDTMLGCGRCHRCRSGRQHVCADRYEIGVRGGWPGALAEQLAVPVTSLHALPATVSRTAGAMVEPGGNALRAVEAAVAAPGRRILIWGPGTIGLLAARFALARGAEVHVVGQRGQDLGLARELGVTGAWTPPTLPALPYDAVVDATNAAEVPAVALDLVEPGGRVVYIGLAGSPSLVDTRELALRDVTAVGILGASPALRATIELYASGGVDPEPLVAATVGLDEVAGVLAGRRPAGPRPKVHVDPRI
ncbi:alcohol dehydrogenase [Planosporangium mesophilum]|uniref:Alcohol dehydrogenase n=2 Tax=Planosporangium mesophilum TaxID=689768 RepID=A0A8J3TCK0_9ACTN|nr:alcohol dehydrogenase catalytic domain-containing protein [Planosporangium mesophilum]NJC83971.1 alcohol dehydrogenase catalytic domain-containing protein [Planosporangium mesophilum]GII22662.1 alcohol dehydrogenase [Planosporangium mesophilum]